jgi:ElaA protein
MPEPFICRLRAWNELSREELYQLLQFRQEVFIVEQDCPYLDADGRDADAYHLWLVDERGLMAAYCRLLPPDIAYPGEASIGRVISRQAFRGQGLGRHIMEEAMDQAAKMWPEATIHISAQCYLERFYGSLGFRGVGDTYLEDGIPHRGMIYDGS